MGSLATIAWTFLKIGLVFVGGGYVLIPLLHRIMVDQYHWLTMKEFLDGLALSQLTPGPLAILATFVGYRAGGFAGAWWGPSRSSSPVPPSWSSLPGATSGCGTFA